MMPEMASDVKPMLKEEKEREREIFQNKNKIHETWIFNLKVKFYNVRYFRGWLFQEI